MSKPDTLGDRPVSWIGRWISRLPCPLASALGHLPGLGSVPLIWLGGQNPRRLCKHLELEGWELWDDPSVARNRIRLDSEGPWPLALWALTYYRGPAVLVRPGLPEVEIRMPKDGENESPPQIVYFGSVPDDISASTFLLAQKSDKGFKVTLRDESR